MIDKDKESKFYIHSKFFDDEKEFWKFVNEWPDMDVDIEDFKREMELKVRDVEMNNKLRNNKLTNKEAYQILRLSTEWVVE